MNLTVRNVESAPSTGDAGTIQCLQESGIDQVAHPFLVKEMPKLSGVMGTNPVGCDSDASANQ